MEDDAQPAIALAEMRMPPLIAAILFTIGILGLFWFDREPEARTSKALWVPVVWFSLAGSRAVSEWLAAFGWGDAQTLDSPEQVLAGSPIDRAVITGLLMIGVVVLATRSQRLGRLLKANLPIMLFLLYCAISISWSDYPEVAAKRWSKAVGDVVMVLIILCERQPYAAIKRFLAWTSFLLIPLSVLLIKYYPNVGLVYNRWTWKPLYGGVTLNKNSLGMICMICGLAAEWRLISCLRDRKLANRSRKLVAHGAVLLMALWLFWIANSMTSLSCFLLGSGLLWLTSVSRVSRRPAVLLTLVASLILFSAYGIFLSADAVEELGRNSTLTGRTEIWQLVLSMGSNPVLGSGFESFWLGDRLAKMWAYNRDIHQAHNGYLEIYLNLGWIGLGLLMSILITGCRRVIRMVLRQEELGGLALAFFAVAIIYNFTEAAFTTMCPVWILLLLTTMAIPRVSSVVAGIQPQMKPAMPMAQLGVGSDFIAQFGPRR